MGRDVTGIVARFADGHADEGRLQWESPKLLFRGAERRVFEGEALKGVTADGYDLVLADGSRFTLGVGLADRWAEAILNPPGRLDKLGVKPGQNITIHGIDDPVFLAELAARAPPTDDWEKVDILFYGANTRDELERLHNLGGLLAERGAIWVISRKGKAAGVKDVEVIAVGRAAGLTDTKVCAFSDTHTALRFVRRKS
ncbi:MAG: hypothetical protein JWP35_4027 [Caulobacter sp.]|nr:hypothetical protein [Caulobacter sp.]